MKIINKLHRNSTRLAVSGTALLLASAAIAETTVTVWCWDPNFNGATMDFAMERYQESHPDVNIKIVDFGKDDLEQKLQSQLASGNSDGLPDIVLIEDYAAQRFLQTFPSSFEPVSQHIDLSGMAPYKVAAGSVGDTAYSMPFDSGVTGIFYRPADLEAAGYTSEDLNGITWDDLIVIGQAVEEATGRKLLAQDFNATDVFRLMLQEAGIWYYNEDGSIDPKFNEVAAKYVELLKSGIFLDTDGWDTYVGAFTGHETTGVAIAVWMTAAIKANEDQSGEWAIAPIPHYADLEGSGTASSVGGSSWYVMADAPEQETALNFLDEIWAQDVGFYEKILVDKGALGSLLAARDTEAYAAPDPFFGGQKVWENWSDWTAEVPEVSYGLFTAEAEAAFKAYIPEVVRGNMELPEAIEAYTQRLTQQIQ